MDDPLEMTLRTLTPLWTGDILGRSGEVRGTSIIGSLRWWYEAIVRGLGGYACDPSKNDRCAWDPKLGTKSVCPACYLFGATGWARLFSLRMGDLGTIPLFFLHLSPANNSWMRLMFDKISSHRALWGRADLSIRGRGVDTSYALQQAKLVLAFASLYAGIGARTQHGFGQFILKPAIPYDAKLFSREILRLKKRIDSGRFRSGTNHRNAPNLARFVYQQVSVDSKNSVISKYKETNPYPNTEEARKEARKSRFLPCAFELRYDAKVESNAGLPVIGFRRWIELNSQANWSDEELIDLLGRTGKRISDEERQGSHISFAMPLKEGDGYKFKVFGFAPEDKTDRLKADLKAYIDALLGVKSDCLSGDDWLAQYIGGGS